MTDPLSDAHTSSHSHLRFTSGRSIRAYLGHCAVGLHCSHSIILKPFGTIVLTRELWKLLFLQSSLLKDHHR